LRKPVILVTGASGELGHGLIEHLTRDDRYGLVGLDLSPLSDELKDRCADSIVGDILDENLLQRLVSQYEIHQIYHLAALLSTRAEYTPRRAHAVNVEGTLNLLELAHEQARWHGNTVKFLFPSSIAAYGITTRAEKDEIPPVREDQYATPTTMYGCNKLYCEQLGRYYSENFKQLSAEEAPSGVDFRSLRYPGLISAVTVPSGGTSDYGPEMLHAAARGEPYACFVDEGARLPFMAMPDAIKALTRLAEADTDSLSQRVYNVTSFSLTAAEFRDRTLEGFPDGDIGFDIDEKRARIVDSWPGTVDDGPARKDWGWEPDYDIDGTFREYLYPIIRKRYS